eukprot:11030999-Alexandrium_andersonii.AAC.1
MCIRDSSSTARAPIGVSFLADYALSSSRTAQQHVAAAAWSARGFHYVSECALIRGRFRRPGVVSGLVAAALAIA